jgi:hypothetical protein
VLVLPTGAGRRRSIDHARIPGQPSFITRPVHAVARPYRQRDEQRTTARPRSVADPRARRSDVLTGS